MLRLPFIVALALTIAACSPTHWTKPGADNAAEAQAAWECKVEAGQAGKIIAGTVALPPPRLVDECMQAHGWKAAGTSSDVSGTPPSDGVALVCENHGLNPGTSIFVSCQQAMFQRNLALANQAVISMDEHGNVIRAAPDVMYGYFMPDGSPVVCRLSAKGVTSGCTKGLQLAWP